MTTENEDRLYPDKDPKELEPYFGKHMMALTKESLYSKGAIAVQLAWRDQENEKLREQLKEAQKEREELRLVVNDFMSYGFTVNPPICPDCNTLLVNIPILGISHICKEEMTEQNGGGE